MKLAYALLAKALAFALSVFSTELFGRAGACADANAPGALPAVRTRVRPVKHFARSLTASLALAVAVMVPSSALAVTDLPVGWPQVIDTIVPSSLQPPERWSAYNYEPPVGVPAGNATDDDLSREFGSVHYFINGCGTDAVDVTVTTTKIDVINSFDPATVELIRRGLIFARERCPQAPLRVRALDLSSADALEISERDIWLFNYGADWFASQAQNNIEANQAHRFWQRLSHRVWVIIQYIALIALAIFLSRKREPIARWYYFTFHPHPAAALVEAAVASSARLDGPALARALGEVPSGSAVFRSVRMAQAEQLFHRMRAVSEARIRQQRARARQEYEHAALNSLQEAVALAAVALERAKALYRASQSVGEERYT